MFLDSYHLPDTVLGVGDEALKETHCLCTQWAYIIAGKTIQDSSLCNPTQLNVSILHVQSYYTFWCFQNMADLLFITRQSGSYYSYLKYPCLTHIHLCHQRTSHSPSNYSMYLFCWYSFCILSMWPVNVRVPFDTLGASEGQNILIYHLYGPRI